MAMMIRILPGLAGLEALCFGERLVYVMLVVRTCCSIRCGQAKAKLLNLAQIKDRSGRWRSRSSKYQG
jgi:hypothetical protein